MKIKKVEIAGFRAYEKREDGTFDFTLESGEVANFVSIYAPNGFGKSSFYDAIEWAITNNISRFTRDSLRSNNNNISLHLNSGDEGQRILRNRYISDTDESYVFIDTTLANTTFKRPVRKAGAGQRDYTFAPNAEPGTEELTNIFLSQDAIDAFLKEDTPEARYEKFMSHFGGDDEQYRLKLNVLRKACAKEIKSLEEQRQKLEENLNKKTVLEAFEYVNATIQQLREAGESQISPISPDTINETTESLYSNHIAQGQQQNVNAFNHAKEKLDLIDECITSLPSFIDNTANTLQIQKQLYVLQANLQMLEARDQSHGLVAEYEARLNTSLKEKETIEAYIVSLDTYIAEKSQLTDYKERKSHLVQEKNALEIQLAENKQLLKDKLLAITEINTNISSKVKDIDDALAIFNQIESNIKRQSEIRGELTQTTIQRDALLIQKNEQEAIRNRIGNMVIDQNVWRLNEYALLNTSEQFTLNFTECIELIGVLRTEVAQNKARLEQLSVLQGDIGKLVNIASELLTQTQSETCPLCSHKHESYESLVSKILNNKGLSQQHQDISFQREARERELLQQTELLTKALAYIEELRKAKFQELTNTINELTDQISRYEQKQRELKLNYEQLEKELSAVKLQTQGMSYEDYIQHCGKQLNSFTLRKNELEISVSQLKEDEAKIAQKIAVYSAELARIDTSVTQIETSEITLKIQDYLTQNSVPPGQERIFIFQQISALVQPIKQIQVCIEQSKTEVARQEQLIINAKGLFNREQLLSQIGDTRLALQEFNNLTTPFTTKLHTLQIDPELINGTDEVLSIALGKLRISLQNAFNSYAQKEMLFSLLAKQLSDVLHLAAYLATKQELNTTNNLLDQYIHLDKKLQQEFQHIEARLKDRINNFFYTDLINKIYSKIDPHPSFKTVNFECIFPAESKPRLEVYLYETTSSRPIAPSLFFSAAQLNVLSLSIFLARALHVEYKGEPVKTILIDDPIHSMDSINILSTIDLLRNISEKFDRQIILSTHDENFHELLKMKIPSQKYTSKFMKLESFGKVMSYG